MADITITGADGEFSTYIATPESRTGPGLVVNPGNIRRKPKHARPMQQLRRPRLYSRLPRSLLADRTRHPASLTKQKQNGTRHLNI